MLATALLEKLHAHFPGASIDLLVRKGNHDLFTEHPFLDRLLVWDKGRGKMRDLFRIIRQIREIRYDHVINCQRFFSTGLMTACAIGTEKIGYTRNPLALLFTRRLEHHIGDGRHEVERLNDLIEHFTDAERPLPRLHPSEKHRNEFSTTGAFVTIAPASVWYTKQWPEEQWVELIRKLPNDLQVLLIGGPGDASLCAAIMQRTGRGENLAGKLSLLGTAALMEQAQMNYVNDSAPLHIASAMKAPVTAVFCSTVPAFGFGPLNNNGRIVETQEQLACRPCGLHGKRSCPKGHFKCARTITTQQVLRIPT